MKRFASVTGASLGKRMNVILSSRMGSQYLPKTEKSINRQHMYAIWSYGSKYQDYQLKEIKGIAFDEGETARMVQGTAVGGENFIKLFVSLNLVHLEL